MGILSTLMFADFLKKYKRSCEGGEDMSGRDATEKTQARFTICTECAHFLFLNTNPALTEEVNRKIWYNHFCQAVRAPVHRDPFDGQVKPMYYHEHEFEHCRDVNKDGNCPYFCASARACVVEAFRSA